MFASYSPDTRQPKTFAVSFSFRDLPPYLYYYCLFHSTLESFFDNTFSFLRFARSASVRSERLDDRETSEGMETRRKEELLGGIQGIQGDTVDFMEERKRKRKRVRWGWRSPRIAYPSLSWKAFSFDRGRKPRKQESQKRKYIHIRKVETCKDTSWLRWWSSPQPVCFLLTVHREEREVEWSSCPGI